MFQRSWQANEKRQRFLFRIPFLWATTAMSTSEQRNNTAAEEEPRTRGQSTPANAYQIGLYWFINLINLYSYNPISTMNQQPRIRIWIQSLLKWLLDSFLFQLNPICIDLTESLPEEDNGWFPKKKRNKNYYHTNILPCNKVSSFYLLLQTLRCFFLNCSTCCPAGRCIGTRTKPLRSLGQGGRTSPDAGLLEPFGWQQELHCLPGRGRTWHQGRQQTRCRASATHLSAAEERGWAPADCLKKTSECSNKTSCWWRFIPKYHNTKRKDRTCKISSRTFSPATMISIALLAVELTNPRFLLIW